MKSHLSILPHTMLSTIVLTGLSLCPVDDERIPQTDIMINNLQETIVAGLREPTDQYRAYRFFQDADITGIEIEENFDTTPSTDAGTPPPPEANNTAGGEPDLPFFLNEMESKDFSIFPIEQLMLRLDQIKARQSKTGNSLMQTIRLGKIRKNLESWIQIKKAAAENEAKDAEIAAKKRDNANGIAGQGALNKEKANGIAGQEALDKDLADKEEELRKIQEKLKIVTTNSNP